MKPGPWRMVLVWGLLPTLAAAALSLYRPPILNGPQDAVYDTLVRRVPTQVPGGNILIVDIDNRSLSTIGQWPWRRDVMGELISRLRDLGASTIALDIIFAEVDRHEASGPGADAALAETLRHGKIVLGYALTFDPVPASASNRCVQHPLNLPIVGWDYETPETPYFRATDAICNLPQIAGSAGASGFLNAAPDPDGKLRRAPVVMEFAGRIYPSLGLASVRQFLQDDNPVLQVRNANTSTLQTDKRKVPLDGKSNLLLRYRGAKRTFPYLSAADVLERRLTPGLLKDKLVFVGTTALGTREVVATPLDTLFAGVEVQATIADNLLQQDFFWRPEHGIALETQAVVLSGLVAAGLFGWLGVAWGAAAVVGCVAAVWIGSAQLLSSVGMYFSPLFPTIGLVGSLATMTAARLTVERRRADRAGEEKETSQRLMIQSLLSLTEVRDAETGKHSRRTQNYARLLATELAKNPHYHPFLTSERIDLLATLAPLHDIGKVGVPDHVLNKPGTLTPEEFAEMRRHPTHGRDVIIKAQQQAGVADDNILSMAKDIVYTHHEKWDGTGYPQGLRGIEIPIPGRIMAIVDVYDAVVSKRVYQSAMSHDSAVELIVARKGTHFDPDVVDAFAQVSDEIHRCSQDGNDSCS